MRVVQMLLEAGAPVYHHTDTGFLPSDMATELGHADIERLLKQKEREALVALSRRSEREDGSGSTILGRIGNTVLRGGRA